MINYKHTGEGPTFAVAYTFERRGDAIPLHFHEEAAGFHDVLCVSGRVAFSILERPGGGGTITVLRPGESISFDNTKVHWVTALEPAQTLHRYLNGQPQGMPTEYEDTIP